MNDIYASWKPTGRDGLNANFAVNNVDNKYYYSYSQCSNSRLGSSLPEVGCGSHLVVNYKF